MSRPEAPSRAARTCCRLLRLYPARYRERFGEGMCYAMEREHREAVEGGLRSLVWFWARTTFQAVTLGLAERLASARTPAGEWEDRDGPPVPHRMKAGRATLGGFMESLIRDVRLGLRSLWRRPGFLAVAVLTLALGIGASTAIFGVIEAALLRPLPFLEPTRLGIVWGVAGPERDIRGASPIEISDWRELTSSFDDLSIYDETNLNLSGDGGPASQLEAEVVSAGFFRLLGVAPAAGRTFGEEDDRAGVAGVAVISDDLWRTRFGGDQSTLGRTVDLDGRPFSIVGIMPAGFKGLSFDTDIWVPLSPFLTEAALEARGNRWLGALGRLQPGVSEQVAQQDLNAAALRLAELYPEVNEDRGALYMPIREAFLDSARAPLLVLLSGVGLLLLIACANVANLQLARTNDRHGELSVRHAIGASRLDIVRQLMTESVMLSLIGAAGGLAVAWAGLKLMLPLVPVGALPTFVDVRLNPGVVGFAIVVALIAGGVLGVVPGMRSNAAPADALRGWRTSEDGRRGRRSSLQRLIVGGQVAVAVVLLAAAGLAIRSFRAQLSIDPGFDPASVLTARVSLPGDDYDAAGRRLFAASLVEAVRGAPGVRSVAIVSGAPLRGGYSASILQREGFPDDRIRYYRHSVTPDYFRTLRIPITAGRGFTEGDGDDAPGVAIVSASFAARIWPGEAALGKRLRIGGSDWATVIGIAGDVHYRDLTTHLMDPSDDADVYFAFAQLPPTAFDIVVRTGTEPSALTTVLRQAVSRLDAAIPLYDIEALESTLAGQTALSRLTSFLLGTFGWLSLLLGAIGLYGVMAFIVRGRRREIAIRGAIGARPTHIRGLVMRQGMIVVGAGLFIGLIGALYAGRVLAGLLYGVRATDPVVFGATAGTLVAVSLLANWVPARQAMRVDPQTALQAD